MSQQELLKQVVKILNKAEVPYMITGSIASSLYGEPRSTHLDLDYLDTWADKLDVRELWERLKQIAINQGGFTL